MSPMAAVRRRWALGAGRALQYGQPGFPPHPPMHAAVYETALRLSGGTGAPRVAEPGQVGGGGGVSKVQLVWTPYEQVFHQLWHVAVRCEADVALDVSEASSPGGSSGRAAALGDDTSARLWVSLQPSPVVCELPSSPPSVRHSIDDLDVAAITLTLPPSQKSLLEISKAREDWRRSWRHSLYLPCVHDCRHFAITVLHFLYSRTDRQL